MNERNAERQHNQKDLLSSRLAERVMGYSWVKFGCDTTSRVYNTAKNSSYLTQYGCTFVENKATKVMNSSIAQGTVDFLAPLIVLADEFGVKQLDKLEHAMVFCQKVVQTLLMPFVWLWSFFVFLPSIIVARAEYLVDYYLPAEKEGPTAGKKPAQNRSITGLIWKIIDLSILIIFRLSSRFGFENLRTRAAEKMQSYETLNDLIVYMRTNDQEKKEKLVRQGREAYWNFSKNYKAIFVHHARAIVQPYIAKPAIRLYNWLDKVLQRVLLRGPFSPQLAKAAGTTKTSHA